MHYKMIGAITTALIFFLSFQPSERIREKAKAAKTYCADKKLNQNLCLLIDMSLHSGKYRAFLYDFRKDSIVARGICSHGCCDSPWGETSSKEKPKFSNTPDSHCSSEGKYRIGKRGYSQWGIHVNYQLHGLESSNSNALTRQIVLHSWSDVPEKEVYPEGSPEGWGCPAVSDSFMRIVDDSLRNNPGALLWIIK
jgi:hypothetical protein